MKGESSRQKNFSNAVLGSLISTSATWDESMARVLIPSASTSKVESSDIVKMTDVIILHTAGEDDPIENSDSVESSFCSCIIGKIG